MNLRLVLAIALIFSRIAAFGIEVDAGEQSDSAVVIAAAPESKESLADQLARAGDSSHKVGIAEFAVPAGVFATSALFVRTPALVRAREYVQKHVSHHGNDKIHADDWIQYAPMVAGYALPFTGYKSQHDVLDRTILLAMSYATFAILSNTAKYSFREKRPDSNSRNSFPSGHTGTAFMGAEFLRREYWDKNKWVAMSGYAVGIAVAYLRIHNDRHWINDVVGGAALGYLSTTFAYWLYPRVFKKRAQHHLDTLLPQTAASQPIVWTAAPFAANGAYGVNATIIF